MDRLAGQDVTRAKVQVWIKSGRARINGQACPRPSRRLAPGERLELDIPAQENELRPESRELRVLYRDDDMVVLNKPAGLAIHPAPGLASGTLVHRLLHHFPELARLPGARPGIVHRLDKDTTGLLVAALNEPARLCLTEAFARRDVNKIYLALVHGRPRPEGTVDAPVGRHPTCKTRMAVTAKGGKPALSGYTLLWTAPEDRFSLVQVRIFSGRTHQIRVHMQHIGHPLLGDPTYCPEPFRSWQHHVPGLNAMLCRPMLHAWKLSLAHPRTEQPLSFRLPPPKDMMRVILVGSRTLQRVGLTGMPGCGKSLFLSDLAALGIPTWSADQAIAELYQPGRDGWELIRRCFGDRFIADETAPVNKQALLQALRETPRLRRELESLIHPLARHHLEDFWEKNRAARVAMAEVPLLLETGWASGFDVVAGVACDPGQRRTWLREGRGWDDDLLADVESWQWAEAQKLRACNLIAVNPGTRPGLVRQAENLAKVLQWLRRQNARRLLSRTQAIVNPRLE